MDNIEVWKDIKGFEGRYEISNYGNIKSIKKNIHSKYHNLILKNNINSRGYVIVRLYKNSKNVVSFGVHQLVAIAFLNHKPCGMELVVNHINFNKKDNRVENLEIVTNRENSNKKHIKSTSKYVGVYFKKETNKWVASIRIKRKLKHLGYYLTEIEASNAYQYELNKINDYA